MRFAQALLLATMLALSVSARAAVIEMADRGDPLYGDPADGLVKSVESLQRYEFSVRSAADDPDKVSSLVIAVESRGFSPLLGSAGDANIHQAWSQRAEISFGLQPTGNFFYYPTPLAGQVDSAVQAQFDTCLLTPAFHALDGVPAEENMVGVSADEAIPPVADAPPTDALPIASDKWLSGYGSYFQFAGEALEANRLNDYGPVFQLVVPDDALLARADTWVRVRIAAGSPQTATVVAEYVFGVPEPASAALLVVGALWRRRRR